MKQKNGLNSILESNYNNINNEISALKNKKDLKDFSVEFDNIQKKIAQFNVDDKISQLKEKLQEGEDFVEKSKNEIIILQNQISILNNKFSLIQDEQSKFEVFENQMIENINSLKNELSISNLQSSNNIKQIDSINTSLKDLETRINNINLEEVYSTIKDTSTKITGKIPTLNTKIKEKDKEILALKSEIDEKINYPKILLPINDKNIESFCFVTMYDGNLIKYTYLKTQTPIGITDDIGNVIIKGLAKVKYNGNITVGDFVYGNKNGVAESHNFGYIVTRIFDNEFCEVLI